MPAVLMVKGSGVERLLPCLHRCNTIIHRKQGRGKKGLKRTTKNLEIVRLTFTHTFTRNTAKTVHKNMIPLNPTSQDNSQDYKGRKIIDAGGADGEG